MEVSDICCKNMAQKELKKFSSKPKDKYTEKDLVGTERASRKLL